jgi:hypothetical protein
VGKKRKRKERMSQAIEGSRMGKEKVIKNNKTTARDEEKIGFRFDKRVYRIFCPKASKRKKKKLAAIKKKRRGNKKKVTAPVRINY